MTFSLGTNCDFRFGTNWSFHFFTHHFFRIRQVPGRPDFSHTYEENNDVFYTRCRVRIYITNSWYATYGKNKYVKITLNWVYELSDIGHRLAVNYLIKIQ